MIRNTLAYMLILSALLIGGCSDGTMQAPRKVFVEGLFSLEVPANLEPTQGLHRFAPLQMADLDQGYFLIGLAEPKDSMRDLETNYGLGDYAWYVETRLEEGLDTSAVLSRDTLDVNGIACHTAEVYGCLDGDTKLEEVYYQLSVMEGATHFYQFIAWTRPSKASTLLTAMGDLNCSFEESLPAAEKATAIARP